LLPVLRYSPSRLEPEVLAIGICEQDARNEVWIEGVEDRLQRGALD